MQIKEKAENFHQYKQVKIIVREAVLEVVKCMGNVLKVAKVDFCSSKGF